MGGDGHPPGDSPGQRIRAARRARGISLRGLAATLHVSPATLSQIENGHTGLSVDRLGRIGDALDLTAEQLLAFVEPEPPREVPGVPAAPGRAPSPAAGWREYGPLEFDPVLLAALEEFLAIGYHGATVRGIASRCGMSVSGIYHYYPSKQRMLVQIMDRAMTDLLARSREAIAEGRDPVARFGLLVENLVLFHTHRKELGSVGASEMRSFEAGNRKAIAEMRTVQQRMVDREVADAVRQGRFRSDHPYDAARAVVTMCTALPSWWQRDGPLTPEQVAERYVGFALELLGRP